MKASRSLSCERHIRNSQSLITRLFSWCASIGRQVSPIRLQVAESEGCTEKSTAEKFAKAKVASRAVLNTDNTHSRAPYAV